MNMGKIEFSKCQYIEGQNAVVLQVTFPILFSAELFHILVKEGSVKNLRKAACEELQKQVDIFIKENS